MTACDGTAIDFNADVTVFARSVATLQRCPPSGPRSLDDP